MTNDPVHPLTPLAPDEIRLACTLVRESGRVSDRARFSAVTLEEPAKAELAAFAGGAAVPRAARLLIYDPGTGTGFDAVVSLGERRIERWEKVEEGQVLLSFMDFIEAMTLVRADPEWQAAMRRRGIEDLELVQLDPWVTADFPIEPARGRRIVRALSYRREFPADNGYARPIEGVIAHVDLTNQKVLRIEDLGVVPEPPGEGRNYLPEHVGPMRDDLKPLEITQPEGPSFAIEGNEVSWQKWRFRVSLHPTQGLLLHTVSYRDGDRQRSILHRAGLSEMVVPYGDSSPMHYWKSVFDAGEMSLGHLTGSLELGCDCLGLTHYFDAHIATPDGNAHTIENAICMHEEDYGILWKHVDLHSGRSEVRRSRRLVVSSIHTVGNYEYSFYWYFYLDGSLQMEVKLTGIVQTSAVASGGESECAPLIAEGLAAPVHQHLFCFRLDFDVDGVGNSVYEVNTDPLPADRNPHGNAFAARETLLSRESEARRDVDPARARYWKVVNPGVTNRLGKPVGYKLVPGSTPRLLARPDSSIGRRAAFARHNLWVTQHDPRELAAAGDHINQHPGGAGLPAWTKADRPLENRDVVLWHSFGVTHVPRPEDWPVMPVEYTGFLLQPIGFFDRNPALDVPPSHPAHCAEA